MLERAILIAGATPRVKFSSRCLTGRSSSLLHIQEETAMIRKYSEVQPTRIDNDKAKGIAGRVVIGKADGAGNFCMRVFEIAPAGHTPKHSHEWEHEIFVHSGEGEIYCDGRWHSAKAGTVVLIPGKEEHQIRNSGKELFTFVCLVPSSAPEL